MVLSIFASLDSDIEFDEVGNAHCGIAEFCTGFIFCTMYGTVTAEQNNQMYFKHFKYASSVLKVLQSAFL